VEASSVGAASAGSLVEGVTGGWLFPAGGSLAAEVAGVVESADSAVPVSPASRVVSTDVIVCRVPCRSLLRPLSPAEPDEPVDSPFALPIVSAGSGTGVLDPGCAVSLPPVAAGTAVAMSSEPERALPALVREDDMVPLSAIVSLASPSGSAVRLGGAMMSGG
jgi:hypothetical protein